MLFAMVKAVQYQDYLPLHFDGEGDSGCRLFLARLMNSLLDPVSQVRLYALVPTMADHFLQTAHNFGGNLIR
jgi:hypothetical protein